MGNFCDYKTVDFLTPANAPHHAISCDVTEMGRCQNEKPGLDLKLGEESLEGLRVAASVKKNVSAKVCARGHWRPAEDARLKELVARFGPQNWNLIAEHLQGRSG